MAVVSSFLQGEGNSRTHPLGRFPRHAGSILRGNMRCFYRLDIEFGLVRRRFVMRKWGRFGARGRTMAERHGTKALAVAALLKQAERKRWRGYTQQ